MPTKARSRIRVENRKDQTTLDVVIAASARSYRVSGLNAFIRGMPLTVGELFIPELNRVEIVETEGATTALSIARVRELKDRGLDVWVLAPLSSMGIVHKALGGSVDRIQPWWIEDKHVQFGEPRFA
jgi:hypothetical protein